MPEVEETVRFAGGPPRLLRVGDKNGIRVSGIPSAESSVFEMFSLSLLRGDPKTALSRPYTMVLTEPLARRLFGEDNPIGQIVRYNEAFDCTVTGIVGQLPSNSLLQFSALLSLATVHAHAKGSGLPSWRTFALATKPSCSSIPMTDAAMVAGRIADIVQQAKGGIPKLPLPTTLQPLKSIYFDKEFPTWPRPEWQPHAPRFVRHHGNGAPDDRRVQLREPGDSACGRTAERNRHPQGPRRPSRPAYSPTPERVSTAERREPRCLALPWPKSVTLLPACDWRIRV